MVRLSAFIIAFTAALICSISAQAGVNPFKKTRNHEFGDEIVWRLKAKAAVKSGRVQQGADTQYYHLNITGHRLRLRLGENDPSGDISNTRDLSKLTIVDVLLDGNRLAQFQYCLDNQQQISKKLKLGASVPNRVCVNAGGDFNIRLNPVSMRELKQTRRLTFIIEPYGRLVKLDYSMAGFVGIMQTLEKPVPKSAIKSKPALKVIPVVKKIKPRPVPVVKKETVKICQATPPAAFKSVVKTVSYPCKNRLKKAEAEKYVAGRVWKQKQEMSTQKQQQQQQQKKMSQASQQEQVWAKKQKARWVKRCEKHWAKGSSPCFCEKYLDSAPAGVINSCGS